MTFSLMIRHGAFTVTTNMENSMAKKQYDKDGQRLTDCCGCYSTYMCGANPNACDELSCKKCYRRVPHGQGDGSEYRDEVTSIQYQIATLKRQLKHWEGRLEEELLKEVPVMEPWD